MWSCLCGTMGGGVVNHIGSRPLPEMYAPDLEIECQCARCGSSVHYEDCSECCGEGVTHHDCGEDCCACLHPENNVPCEICNSTGVNHFCLSSAEWCQANPIPGREGFRRGEIEWFTIRTEANL